MWSTTRWLVASVLSLSVAGTGCTGSEGPPGPPGSDGSAAPTTGTISGTVTDGIAHTALASVAVTITDDGGSALATATTDATGSFGAIVPAGPMELSFAKPDYTPPGILQSGVGAGATVHVAVTMNESASGAPSIMLSTTGDDFGYGAAVPIVATATDPNGDSLTYAWANATEPLIGSVTGGGSQGTVTMPSITDAFSYRPDPTNPGQFLSGYPLWDRFGTVPIMTDTRGQVTATVTVNDGRGQSATASLELNAASLATGTRDVPVGQRIYMNSGHDTGNAWTLTSAPPASTAAFDDPTSRTPSFVVDRAGEYTLTETGGAAPNSLTITAGTWRGALAGGSGDTVTPDSACTMCHGATFQNAPPDMFTPWLGTEHATMFTRGIDGAVSSHYAGSCVGCHTVGYDLGVANNGFDDAAAANGWTFPATLGSDNWADMIADAPAVAQLANIQCESCHGPQTSDAHMSTWSSGQSASAPFQSPRISYSAEACGTCHAAGGDHIYSEWATQDAVTGMGHSNRVDPVEEATSATGLNSSCGRCHVAQGYTLYASLLTQGKVALTSVPAATLALVTGANAEPVTCVACHDPHDATNPNQLRFYDDTPNLPSGFAGYGMGKGAVCLTCHNSRNGGQNNSDSLTFLHEDTETYNGGNPTGYSAPHQADQGDVFVGHNAYFLGASLPMTSKHAAITDTCVGCHMTLQPQTYQSHGTPAASTHVFRITDENEQTLCASCHGSSVNGAGIQATVEAQLAALDAKLGKAFVAKVAAVGGKINVRAYDPATGYYSSPSASNVLVDTTANPIVSATLDEVHGQVSIDIVLANPISIPFVDGNNNPAPAKSLAGFGVQLGALKDNQTTPAVLYPLTGNFIRAGWNYFLIEGDQSKGLHNPSFVTAVLDASLAKDVSN